jgi:DNA polymerase II small subunit
MEFSKEMLNHGYLLESNLTHTFEELKASDDDLLNLKNTLISLKPPKFISKDFFLKNLQIILGGSLSEDFKKSLESLQIIDSKKKEEKILEVYSGKDIEVIEEYPVIFKKINVEDFVKYFRSRFNFFKRILQERELENITSINKITSQRRNVSIIGIVSAKRISKNKNIILLLEDMTGTISVVIRADKQDLAKKAGEIVLDEVIAVSGSGNSEILFANDVFFPEVAIKEKKKSPEEVYAIFTGDLHIGSNKFLEENFLKFIEWLNGNLGSEKQTALAKKIKYLFLVGDIVDSVGVYPGQEKELIISDVYEQYKKAAELISKIRKDIKIIICPGNHDAVRIVEPQPHLDKELAAPLYALENLTMTTNPAYIKIGATKEFSGYNVLMYHGRSFDDYANDVDVLRLNHAMANPGLILNFLLRKRHLAPTHGSTTYFPLEEDFLIIKKIPDVLVSAHIHKSGITFYNGIIGISTSCWQARTPYQEKFGHEPDPCKVPILNMQTGKINILDFS